MILVTGASGFLGLHLVHRLSAQGKQVRALYHRNPPGKYARELPGADWQSCDLLDIYAVEEVMEGISEVYHCAAMVSFRPADRTAMLHFNVESTAHIVDEALDRNIRKLVHVSSISSLGRSKTSGIISEEEEWDESPYNTIYSRSKYLSELEVWRGIASGLEAVIVNPAILLGAPFPAHEDNRPAWRDGPARLMQVVNREFPFYTGGINGWVDVADVVSVMMILMDSEFSGERFLLSAGNVSYREIFTQMAEALGKKPPHLYAGSFLSGIVWRWNALLSAITGAKTSITRETAITAAKKQNYDNGKLLRMIPDFHYTAMKVTVSTMATRFQKDFSKKISG